VLLNKEADKAFSHSTTLLQIPTSQRVKTRRKKKLKRIRSKE